MAKKTNNTLAKLLYSAMFLSLGLLLPFLTAQIPQFGASLLPMHLPVILCGFVCGPMWGLTVGAATPLLRSFIFVTPILIPDAIAMAFELAVYAFVAGLLFKKLRKNIFMCYIALITSMVCGRLVWGAVMFILIFAGVSEGTIALSLIWTNTVLQSIPGIILQLVAIPVIVNILRKNRLLLNR